MANKNLFKFIIVTFLLKISKCYNNFFNDINAITPKQTKVKYINENENDDQILNTFPGKYIKQFDDSYISKIEGNLKYLNDKSKRRLSNIDNLFSTYNSNELLAKDKIITRLVIALLFVTYLLRLLIHTNNNKKMFKQQNYNIDIDRNKIIHTTKKKSLYVEIV